MEVLSGKQFGLRDSTNVDYARWDHDGTDFNLNFGGTTDYNIVGLTGKFKFNSDVYVKTGKLFVIRDSTNSDDAAFSHDGTGAGGDYKAHRQTCYGMTGEYGTDLGWFASAGFPDPPTLIGQIPAIVIEARADKYG